jgi:hypothetical protein
VELDGALVAEGCDGVVEYESVLDVEGCTFA